MANTISNGVVAADSTYLSNDTSSKKETSNDMGKDAFIQLLVTQMKYQDPLNPMDNQEMLAQLAQFTALEQMMNVAHASQKQLANGMIGKYVEYLYKDSTTGKSSYQIGKVDYVNINGDTPILGIGDIEVSIEDVYQVLDGNNIQSSSSAFDVVGKTVQATTTETSASGEKVSVVIEGKVEGIKMVDGKPHVIIGTGDSQKVIAYDNVQSIVENTSVTGREVTATITNPEGKKETITGTVDYIKITSEGTYLNVNGNFINFNDVEIVK
ncbi:MAG: flagellar hook capping protein [Cellulosilyticum sp.]|nr:flagellar hook capping protein [Cellulosilyticum sp.]